MNVRSQQRINAFCKNDKNYKNIILPSSMISFQSENLKSLKTIKTKLKIALQNIRALQNSCDKPLSILLNISKSIKIIKKYHKTMERLCSQFPYEFFFSLLVTSNDINISLLALKIFSYCSNSQHFPKNHFSNQENINFCLNLFNQIEAKYHKYIFKIFIECIKRRPDIRNYLLKNNVFSFVNPESTSSIDFLAMCLSTDPDIEKGYANTACLFLSLALKGQVLKAKLHVLNMFKLKSFAGSKVIDPNIIQYILTDFAALNLPNTQIPILNVALSVKLDSKYFIPLVMNYFGIAAKDNSKKKLIRKCMKILVSNYEEWQKVPEILEYLVKFLPGSYEVERDIAQIIMLYVKILPEIDPNIIGFIAKFLSDKIIGLHCLSFLYQVLSIVSQSENDEIIQRMNQTINECIEEIETMSMEGEEQIQEVALSLMKIYSNMQRE